MIVIKHKCIKCGLLRANSNFPLKVDSLCYYCSLGSVIKNEVEPYIDFSMPSESLQNALKINKNDR